MPSTSGKCAQAHLVFLSLCVVVFQLAMVVAEIRVPFKATFVTSPGFNKKGPNLCLTTCAEVLPNGAPAKCHILRQTPLFAYQTKCILGSQASFLGKMAPRRLQGAALRIVAPLSCGRSFCLAQGLRRFSQLWPFDLFGFPDLVHFRSWPQKIQLVLRGPWGN